MADPDDMNLNPTVQIAHKPDSAPGKTTVRAETVTARTGRGNSLNPNSPCHREAIPRPEVLLRMALETAEAVGLQLPSLGESAQHDGSPQHLLALLIHSYANEIYASEEVEWTFQNEPMLQAVFGKRLTDEHTLRAFRRAHRPWIEAGLAKLMQRQSQAEKGIVWQGRHDLSPFNVELESPFRLEAHRRVNLTVLMDTAMSE